MRLTDYEKAMLNGKYGEVYQQAIQTLYDLSRFYNVEKFVEVVGCHDDSTVYAGEAQVAFVEMLASKGAKFAVPTTTNSVVCDLKHWHLQKFDIERMSASKRIEASHIQMGAIPTWTCAPYHVGISPSYGQQFAAAESNVICYYNSIIGARTNRYAGPLELLCGITGRAPFYGLHVTENRYAQGLVRIGSDIKHEYFKDEDIFILISYAYGSIVKDRVWALDGVPKRGITNEILKQFSATACSSGGMALFHLIGVTPEAQTIEHAFGGKKPSEVIEIHLPDLLYAENQLTNPNITDLDAILFGCPHASYNECVMIKELFRGRKVNRNLRCWIITPRSILKMLKDSYIYEELIRLGIEVYSDGCILECRDKELGFKYVMSNSGKFGTYCFAMHGVQSAFGSMKECVESAIAGKVTKEFRPWRR